MIILLTIFAGMTNLALSFYAFKKAKNVQGITAFSIGTIALSAWILLTMLRHLFPEEIIWHRLGFFLVPIIMICFLAFISRYPGFGLRIISKKLFVFLSLPLILIMALSPSKAFVQSVTSNGLIIYGPFFKYYVANQLIFFLITILIFIIGYQSITSVQRQRFTYFIIGGLLVFGLAILSNLILPLLGIYTLSNYGSLFSIIFTAFTVYTIVCYQLMDIRLILTKSVSVILIIAFWSLIYTLLFGIVLPNLPNKTQWIGPIKNLFLLFIGLTFCPIHRTLYARSKTLLNLHNEQAILEESTSQLFNCTSAKDIVLALRKIFQKHFGIQQVEIYQQISSHQFQHIQDATQTHLPEKISASELHQFLSKKNQSVIHETLLYPINTTLFNCMIPCTYMNTTKMIILLDTHTSQLKLSKEEATIFKKIAADVAKVHELIALKEETQKLKEQNAFAQLTRNISHEIKNPMSMLLSRIEILEDQKNNPEAIQESVNMLKRNILRLIKLTESMLKYSSQKTNEVQSINLQTLIEDIILLCETQAKKQKITLHQKCHPNMQIKGNSHRIHQAFLNLIVNAMEAMPNGGSLTIQCTQDHFKIGTTKTKGIRIDFIDTGTGIDASIAKTLFDPFISTKNKNSGLGLALVASVINEHNGKIEVSSDSNGTTFHIYLPTAPTPQSSHSSETPEIISSNS